MRTRRAPTLVVATVAVAGLLAACLTLGLAGRLGDRAEPRRAAPTASVVGDDLPTAVLPAAITFFVAALVVVVVTTEAASAGRRWAAAARDRAPPPLAAS
jgi:hypothetical protein